ncbi:MAG: YchJ family protein [Caldilineaceae bacterium]|nr:YchJ family protein [Caldilineaceae bacterium]
MSEATQCPCGSGMPYALCCEPYLAGAALPSHPEELMRSRYTAFCRQDVAYLIATHHPAQRQPDDDRELRVAMRDTEWLSLRLLAAPPARGKQGTVEFVAFYRNQGTVGQLHERSTFIREDGRWYYREGLRLPPVAMGRNDPCWCGSGRKLKQCHGQ